MMTYFREAVIHTDALLDLLVKCENKAGSVDARGGRPARVRGSRAAGRGRWLRHVVPG